MKTILLLCGLLLSLSQAAHATITIQGPSKFKANVEFHLSQAKRQSDQLKRLINAAEIHPSIITITPITNDKSTWHYKGDKSRSHTEASDNKKRGAKRDKPTNSIIFINTNRITPSHKTYKSGTLIHEIVHALDLANGLYNSDYKIRERRAIFFQNIWRSLQHKTLRSNYHDRFQTLDYQNAVNSGTINTFVTHYFSHNDLP